MQTPIEYLNIHEETAIRLLADGKKSKEIGLVCEVPAAGMPFFRSELRRKTGIPDLNRHDCRMYLDNYKQSLKGPKPSEQGIRIFRKIMDGETLEGIAYTLDISKEDFPEVLRKELALAGIFATDERARRSQARMYVAANCPQVNVCQPSDTHLKMLRMMAEGKEYIEIASELNEKESYVRAAILETCRRLGFASRGRHVQQLLIRKYIEQLDAKGVHPSTENTMDDPAF